MNGQLRRTLSLRDLIFIVVGTVIGSGIFLTPGSVVRNAGSGGMALVVWTVGGVLSLLGALTFAELGAAKPESGGLYVYLRDAFGPAIAFLFGWTMFLVIGAGSLATLGAAFPRYVGVFVPLSPAAEKGISLVMIAAVTLLNVRGTRQSADVQGVATVIKAGVIVLLSAALIVLTNDVPREHARRPARLVPIRAARALGRSDSRETVEEGDHVGHRWRDSGRFLGECERAKCTASDR